MMKLKVTLKKSTIGATEGQIAGYAWYRWRGDDDEGSGFGICLRREYQRTKSLYARRKAPRSERRYPTRDRCRRP